MVNRGLGVCLGIDTRQTDVRPGVGAGPERSQRPLKPESPLPRAPDNGFRDSPQRLHAVQTVTLLLEPRSSLRQADPRRPTRPLHSPRLSSDAPPPTPLPGSPWGFLLPSFRALEASPLSCQEAVGDPGSPLARLSAGPSASLADSASAGAEDWVSAQNKLVKKGVGEGGRQEGAGCFCLPPVLQKASIVACLS